MKKFRNAIVLLAAGVAFAACQNNGKTAANAGTNDSTANDSAATDSVVYEGTVPAADGPGTFYKLPTSDGSGETVLKVVNDSTLRLVNSDFEEAASKLNYDLKLKK